MNGGIRSSAPPAEESAAAEHPGKLAVTHDPALRDGPLDLHLGRGGVGVARIEVVVEENERSCRNLRPKHLHVAPGAGERVIAIDEHHRGMKLRYGAEECARSAANEHNPVREPTRGHRAASVRERDRVDVE